MKAFIPAAGFGKRMGELSEFRPKPLLELHGVPLIYYALFQLKRWGIQDCVINLHYLGEKIREELRDFPHFSLQFSEEPEILGTAGGIKKALPILGDRFVVLNPDSVLLAEESVSPDSIMKKIHARKGGILGLLTRTPESKETAIHFNRNSSMASLGHSDAGFFYMGYSLLCAEEFAELPANVFAELGTLWKTESAGIRLSGFEYSGFYMDVGARVSFEKANSVRLPHQDNAEWLDFISFRKER